MHDKGEIQGSMEVMETDGWCASLWSWTETASSSSWISILRFGQYPLVTCQLRLRNLMLSRRNIIYEMVLSTHNDEQKVAEKYFCQELAVPLGSSIAYPALLLGVYDLWRVWFIPQKTKSKSSQ